MIVKLTLVFTYSSLGSTLFGFINKSGNVIEGVFPWWVRFPAIVIVTTLVWVITTLVTKPEKKEVLNSFYKKT